MGEHELGCYTGKLVLEPLVDGRRMKTVLDFGFQEADGLHWRVPPGSTVDGASIPQPLWSLMGGPWEGKYRDASVVHDYYCAVRSADWQSVHRMFYRAMLVSGVSVLRAKTMYLAVYFAGPRWDDMVVDIVRLGPPAFPTRPDEVDRALRVEYDPVTVALSEAIELDGRSAHDLICSGPFPSFPRDREVILHLDKLSEIVERDNPSLPQLEEAIDTAVSFIPSSFVLPEPFSRGVSVGDLRPEE